LVLLEERILLTSADNIARMIAVPTNNSNHFNIYFNSCRCYGLLISIYDIIFADAKMEKAYSYYRRNINYIFPLLMSFS